jgi:LmbE family N-acetylglucosaminyl deacetylase
MAPGAAHWLFISPHLDDAVFSCGVTIASAPRATVATLFAGRPPSGAPLTRWDGDCGFRAGEDVVGARREEDRSALAALGARAVWLDLLDDQYGASPTAPELLEAVHGLVEREAPDAVFFPLGLFHADHVRASDAALALVGSDARRWYAYEDALYRRIEAATEGRRSELRRRGFTLRRHIFIVENDAGRRKRDAVECYRSQLTALALRDGHDDAFAAEACWRVARTRQAAARKR